MEDAAVEAVRGGYSRAALSACSARRCVGLKVSICGRGSCRDVAGTGMRCREKEDVAHDARVGSQRVLLHILAQYCSSVSWPKGNKRESAALVFSWQLAEARRRSCAGMGECLVRDGGEGWRPRRDGRDVGGEGLLGACRPSSEMGGETGWQYLRVGLRRHGVSCGTARYVWPGMASRTRA